MARGGNKFAAIFDQPPVPATEPEPVAKPEPLPRIVEAQVPAMPHAVRPIGRPPGKRSDPAWKQYSVLLRRDTQREATSLLRVKDEGDLSGLVQKLLEAWVKKQNQ